MQIQQAKRGFVFVDDRRRFCYTRDNFKKMRGRNEIFIRRPRFTERDLDRTKTSVLAAFD